MNLVSILAFCIVISPIPGSPALASEIWHVEGNPAVKEQQICLKPEGHGLDI
jgi:hypothetical protein